MVDFSYSTAATIFFWIVVAYVGLVALEFLVKGIKSLLDIWTKNR